MFLVGALLACAECTRLEEMGYTLVEFCPEVQDVKLYSQIRDASNLVNKTFHNGAESEQDLLMTYQHYHVFNLRRGDSLVANVFVKKTMYFDVKESGGSTLFCPKDIISRDALEIYSFVVDERYRKKGISGEFLSSVFKKMKEKYLLDDGTIIGLHLNSKDPMMSVSFGLYIRFGFNRARTCCRGPCDLEFSVKDIFQLGHPLKAARNVILGDECNRFFAMYTTLGEFRRKKVSLRAPDLTLVGKMLQDKLDAQQAKAVLPGGQ